VFIFYLGTQHILQKETERHKYKVKFIFFIITDRKPSHPKNIPVYDCMDLKELGGNNSMRNVTKLLLSSRGKFF
jgi:hypothetical protein